MKKYKLLDYAQIDRIVEILRSANLDKPVKVNSLGLKTEFNNLSKATFHPGKGDGRYIQNNNQRIDLKKKDYYFTVGDWRRENVENSKGHILFISNLIVNKFHIECGFCLQDENFIHFAKKLYQRGGQGSMQRYVNQYDELYQYSDKNAPFDILLEVVDNEVLDKLNEKWISLSKIEKSKLFDKKYENEILHTFLSDVTHFLFSLENILTGKKDDLTKEVLVKKDELQKEVIAQKSLRQILSSEDKKRIELAAMGYVKNKWEEKGFLMSDVSANRGEEWGYDFEAEDGEDEYYVEVKGTTIQGDWNIIMTKNEYNASEKHGYNYFLCIVQFDNKEDLNVVYYEAFPYSSQNEDLQIEPYTYIVKKS